MTVDKLEGSIRMTKAISRMLFSVLEYILAYAVFAVLLGSLRIDACVVQAMSGMYVIYRSWKREHKKGMDYLEVSGFKTDFVSKKELLILAGLGFSLNCFIGGVMNLLPINPQIAADYMKMSSEPVEGVHPVLAFFVIAVAAPIIEETFFRGTLLRRMAAEVNPFYALIVTSLVFGFMHGQIIWIIYASVLGLVLGMIYLLYRSIYPSMIVHMTFNLVSGIPMLMNPSGIFYRWTYGNQIFRILMAAGGAVGVFWILFQIYFPRFMKMEDITEYKENETS